jgi:hypothetical protein
MDISTPTAMTPYGSIDTNNGRLDQARDIIVEGDYAYVTAKRNDSFQVLDISDPANPVFAAELTNL